MLTLKVRQSRHNCGQIKQWTNWYSIPIMHAVLFSYPHYFSAGYWCWASMLSYNHSTRVKEKFRKYILAQTFVIVVRLLCKYSICHISTLTKNPETRLLVSFEVCLITRQSSITLLNGFSNYLHWQNRSTGVYKGLFEMLGICVF